MMFGLGLMNGRTSTGATWWCVSRTLRLRLCCAVTIACFGGCGGERGPERVVVSGTVAYNGKPIPEGVIRFVPVSTSLGPTAGAIIANGKYRADGNGGVPVGMHNIQVEAYRKTAYPVKPAVLPPRGFEDGLREQYLPKRHNVDSQLRITIESGSRTITKDFDLTD
jgi:hypothetical protein